MGSEKTVPYPTVRETGGGPDSGQDGLQGARGQRGSTLQGLGLGKEFHLEAQLLQEAALELNLEEWLGLLHTGKKKGTPEGRLSPGLEAGRRVMGLGTGCSDSSLGLGVTPSGVL